MGKIFIGVGIAFIVIGLLWHFDVFKHIPLGRLPGDIRIENENTRFYFPITTSILVSIILSLLFHLFQRFR